MCEAVTDTSKSDSLAEYLLTGSFSGWLKKKKTRLGLDFLVNEWRGDHSLDLHC